MSAIFGGEEIKNIYLHQFFHLQNVFMTHLIFTYYVINLGHASWTKQSPLPQTVFHSQHQPWECPWARLHYSKLWNRSVYFVQSYIETKQVVPVLLHSKPVWFECADCPLKLISLCCQTVIMNLSISPGCFEALGGCTSSSEQNLHQSSCPQKQEVQSSMWKANVVMKIKT